MAKTIDAAKREAGKKNGAKKVKKNVEAKPLMTLEEAREVLKRRAEESYRLAITTESGADDMMFSAESELKGLVEVNTDLFFNAGSYDCDEEWHAAMRKAVKDISDAVEFVIAADTNLNLFTPAKG